MLTAATWWSVAAAPAGGEAGASAPAPASAASERRPLAVARQSDSHQWTAGNGRDPDVIRRIAHNDLEARRMMEENDRIKRRQLVYRKETAWMTVQRSRASGEPIRTLTLPGLDGQELVMVVTSADVAPSGESGSFTGRLPNRAQSKVTLAFLSGHEAFTVSSPEDHFYLQADAREPGEVIVKSIDPGVYAAGACGNR